MVVRRLGLPVEQLPDETLLAGLGRGDEEIALAFVRRFQGRVYGVALSVLRDSSRAEDAAQQAFERAWRHAGSYDPRRGSVGAWLTTIARNVSIDSVRAQQAAPADTDDLLLRVASGRHGPETAALAGLDAEQLRSALRRLPQEQARAVVLAGIAGMTASQIAESEGIPLGTAKTRIRAGMGRLRVTLAAPAEALEGIRP